MNQSVSALGSVVRATRKSKNLSQEALAEKLGVCKRTIQRLAIFAKKFVIFAKTQNCQNCHNKIEKRHCISS